MLLDFSHLDKIYCTKISPSYKLILYNNTSSNQHKHNV